MGAALLGSSAAGAVLRRIGPQQEGFSELIRRTFKPTARSASAGAVLGDVGAALLGSSAAGAVLRCIGPQQEGFSGLIRRTFNPTARSASAGAVLGDVGSALAGFLRHRGCAPSHRPAAGKLPKPHRPHAQPSLWCRLHPCCVR